MAALSATAAETSSEDSLETIAARRARESPPLLNLNKPNEIKAGSITYSGVTVEVARNITNEPWQVINPFAPASFGQADYNVSLDPITGRASGIRLFSIEF